jgi:hypothetical protein
VRRRLKNVDVRSVFRLVVMERLAKERITVKIASLFFKFFSQWILIDMIVENITNIGFLS